MVQYLSTLKLQNQKKKNNKDYTDKTLKYNLSSNILRMEVVVGKI